MQGEQFRTDTEIPCTTRDYKGVHVCTCLFPVEIFMRKVRNAQSIALAPQHTWRYCAVHADKLKYFSQL